MKERAFNFLKELINSKHIGDIIERKDLVNKLIQYYRPNLKDKSNSSIRTVSNPTLNIMIKIGVLERIGLGKYKILKPVPINLSFKEIRVYGTYSERKAN